MPYLKKTVRAGATIEVRKYYSPRYGKTGKRADWINPTPEDVAKINEKNSVIRLRQLMNANFAPGDWHLVLTYRRENRCSPEEAQKRLSNFLRSARRVYRSVGDELKYIWVTELLSTALHHHILAPGIDIRFLQAIWPYGQIRPTPIYTYDLDYLAQYFVKETKNSYKLGVTGRRWGQSKNLEKPVETVEVVQADSWRDQPRVPDGYRIIPDTLRVGYDDYNGYAYQEYRMVRAVPESNHPPSGKDPPKNSKPKRRTGKCKRST